MLAELAEWAATILKLPNATQLERLSEEMEKFDSEFLLSSSLREDKLRVLGHEGLEARHISRDLGGALKVERRDGGGDEWIVLDTMHAPSPPRGKKSAKRIP